jgi:antitoxin VapB
MGSCYDFLTIWYGTPQQTLSRAFDRWAVLRPGNQRSRDATVYLWSFSMGMNIKSDETHRRAKELARITGETIAEAVDRAVSERLDRLRRQRNRRALAAKLLKLGDECSRLPVMDKRSADEMLYEERELPR